MRKLRSRGATGIVLTAAALVASVVFAPQASAGININEKNVHGKECSTSSPKGAVCVWRDPGYAGDYYFLTSDRRYREGGMRFTESSLTQSSLYNNSSDYVSFQNDRISSIKVRVYNSAMCFYQHPGFHGKELRIGGWEDVSNLRDRDRDMNDQISSFRPC